MKLEIKIDTNVVEPEAVITTAGMTDEVNRVVNYISNMEEATSIITGQKDGKIELLDQDNIIRLYAEDGKVFAKTNQSTYQIRLRLYELEERLDSEKFVRISNSEIVNLKKVKSLDLSFVGTICMEFVNGEVSYVSRRYVSRIKKVLGL
ncbi:MAG: LytTR family DNA-binding domain-containing protein [Lachnospiraceae bacterium]